MKFAADLQTLTTLVERLQRGDLKRADFRSQSVHLGVYTQRQLDRYFVRLRLPLGHITPRQLNTLAGVVERWADGQCHLTTRQGLEIHNLALENLIEVLTALFRAGLSSHESGGNTVRGLVACPHAGQTPEESFDVAPYAVLLNQHLFRHPDFQTLPRKIKIGFSSCSNDCSHTVLHDLGFQARVDALKQPGFRVLIGGGAGSLPRLGRELLEFLPAKELLIFTEAFLRMFNRLGDRQNRRRSRVKFLVESLGVERLRQEIYSELATLKCARRKWPVANLAATDSANRHSDTSLRVALPAGNIASGQMRCLAALGTQFGLGLSVTPDQGILLQHIPLQHISIIHADLNNAALTSEARSHHLTSCPGASCCSNAYTNSAALADEISHLLAAEDNGAPGSNEPLRIRLSGCTNGCALHVIADIGLEGLAQRREGGLIPAYRLWLGGRAHQQRPRLANDLGIIPARRAAECVRDVIGFYRRECQPGESVSQVLDRIGSRPFETIVQRQWQTDDIGTLAMDVGATSPYRAQGDAATTC